MKVVPRLLFNLPGSHLPLYHDPFGANAFSDVFFLRSTHTAGSHISVLTDVVIQDICQGWAMQAPPHLTCVINVSDF